MENEKKKICWEYLDIGARAQAPIIQAELIVANKREKYTFVVDTGYDGSLLIPYSIYKELELKRYELPKNLWDVGETVSGEIIPLIASLCKVKIGNTVFETTVETFEGNKEFLAGISFLDKFITTLEGDTKRCCLQQCDIRS